MTVTPEHSPTILLVDDDVRFTSSVAELYAEFYHIMTAATADEAVDLADDVRPDVILLDIDLGKGRSGLDVLPRLLGEPDAPPVIMLTRDTAVSTVVAAMKAGAQNYVSKPPDFEELQLLIRRAVAQNAQRRRLEFLRDELQHLRGSLLVEDPVMKRCLEYCKCTAATRDPVLILGETGVGKGMIARYLHDMSPCRNGPYIEISCADLPETLIESVLFGHEPGAFTDASSRKLGLFDRARDGTLFLDEIGEASPGLQAKLLRVLREGTYERLGGTTELHTNARIITATNQNLSDFISKKRFRLDLYMRLATDVITVPPLRERPGDVLPLAELLLANATSEWERTIEGFSASAEGILRAERWPGNVGELRNRIRKAAAHANGNRIRAADLFCSSYQSQTSIRPHKEALRDYERSYFTELLTLTGGNVNRAAELAGLTEQHVYRKIKQLGLDLDAFRRDSGNGPEAEMSGHG